MEGLNKLELSKKQLENLPLFFRRIYWNKLSNIEDEEKLFRYSKKSQSFYMRHFYPSRPICKTFNLKKLKESDENGK
ncbi:MAG: hypothetical protein R3353_00175 [Salegentibacter mishustinae]|nr:hypothetical protein [Salegentibacter mishustinae]